MKIITFANVKGGTGKTTISLLTALSLVNKRVLFIDLDPQHSGTFFFETDLKNRSVFNSLMGAPAVDQVIKTELGIDLLPSDVRLWDCRTIENIKLKKLVKQLDGVYDYIIIDTAPTYDSLTQNAYLAADIIIMPSLIDTFSLKSIKFLIAKLLDLKLDADIGILLNEWKPPKETIKDTAYSKREANLFLDDANIKDLILKSHLPRLKPIKRFIDESGNVLKAEKTLEHVNNFVSEITGRKIQNEKIGVKI